jgi:hypothetical protein
MWEGALLLAHLDSGPNHSSYCNYCSYCSYYSSYHYRGGDDDDHHHHYDDTLPGSGSDNVQIGILPNVIPLYKPTLLVTKTI